MLGIVVSSEEVKDGLVIDFEIGASDQELLVFLIAIDEPKDVIEGFRYNALGVLGLVGAHHCVCLSTPSLAVGKYGS
jgi:hypothetical protein